MLPEFNRITKDILGKRAALLCSNPDCRTTTSGPADDPGRAVNIGEAAHIFGAYATAARYRSEMTDGLRAEVANAIWLCRNCHKLVDNDPIRYSADLLFRWRGEHERYVTGLVGSRTDVMEWDLTEQTLESLLGGNPFAKQIARDHPAGWEFRLIAELLRWHLKPTIQAWSELKGNLVAKRVIPIDDDAALRWFEIKLDEGVGFIDPLTALYTVELEKSWGPPGEPGDVVTIARVCELIGNVAKEMIRWEEEVKFVWVSDTYRALPELLRGCVGRNLERLFQVPAIIDEGIDHAEANPGEPTIIEHTLIFDLPDGWSDAVSRELKRIQR